MSRSAALDRLRGLAIAVMVLDHVALLLGPTGWLLQVTVGRLAMPLFFVISGHLVRRLSWRTAGIAALGAVLPLVFGWLDSPNVLLWYAAGAVLIVAAQRLRVPVAWLLVVLVAVAANGWDPQLGTSYRPAAVLALMVIGHLLPRMVLDRAGARLPAWLELGGRRPVSSYVVQAAAVTGLALVVGA